MSDEQLQELQQLTDKMSGLCAQLEKADSMSDAEYESFIGQVKGVCGALESDFSVIAFRPDVVPEATQKMFFTLAKLFLDPRYFAVTA